MKQTDEELIKLLASEECEVIDNDVDSFTVHVRGTGARTRLEADNLSDALFEAWNLVKP